MATNYGVKVVIIEVVSVWQRLYVVLVDSNGKGGNKYGGGDNGGNGKW